jgi:hypothetical protein
MAARSFFTITFIAVVGRLRHCAAAAGVVARTVNMNDATVRDTHVCYQESLRVACRDMCMRDKRLILRTIRELGEQEDTRDAFFPHVGVTANEYCICVVARDTLKRRQKSVDGARG